jgi:Kef-type K+ transport system membrane component KefB
MLKKILTNAYVIGGIVVFVLLFFIGIFGIGFTWGEALFGAAALSVIGTATVWWRREVWS